MCDFMQYMSPLLVRPREKKPLFTGTTDAGFSFWKVCVCFVLFCFVLFLFLFFVCLFVFNLLKLRKISHFWSKSQQFWLKFFFLITENLFFFQNISPENIRFMGNFSVLGGVIFLPLERKKNINTTLHGRSVRP